MNTKDPRFKKWDRWLDEIHKDIRKLLWYRYVFREVGKIVESNPKIQVPSEFYNWMISIYEEVVPAGVRRHSDMHKDAISLAKLLYEIRCDPQVLSIAPNEVDKDLSELQNKSKVIKGYVDKTIAHLDNSKAYKLPTYKELNDCLDYLEELLKKYLRLFRPTHFPTIVPVYQYDWMVIFRRPWIEPAYPTDSN